MFELSKVTVRYGDRPVLDAVSATLGPEPLAVMGPSGSGKTTLLRVLAGQSKPDRGRVTLSGQPVRVSRGTIADDRIALIHQDYRLVEFLSVLDNVMLASELRGRPLEQASAVATLEGLGLPRESLHRKPETLSGGEQQRVAIARALLCGAKVLLADEPTGALDADATNQITDLLLEVADSGAAQVIVATHDLAVARRMVGVCG